MSAAAEVDKRGGEGAADTDNGRKFVMGMQALDVASMIVPEV